MSYPEDPETLATLPAEVIYEIMRKTDYYSIMEWCRTSKRFQIICDSEFFLDLIDDKEREETVAEVGVEVSADAVIKLSIRQIRSSTTGFTSVMEFKSSVDDFLDFVPQLYAGDSYGWHAFTGDEMPVTIRPDRNQIAFKYPSPYRDPTSSESITVGIQLDLFERILKIAVKWVKDLTPEDLGESALFRILTDGTVVEAYVEYEE